jgi:hypothetical protein
MRFHPLALAILALATAFTSRAAEKPRPAQAQQNRPQKVWTNDDMDQLRARGLISIVGQEVRQAAPQPELATAESSSPVYASRLQDPEWYAQKAADLQAELDKNMEDLHQARTALALAANGKTQPGINLDQNNVGITPDAGIAILEARVNEVQGQLDELSDLARRNDIPPGVLRG